jgi:macrolide-specific efflux system membrane fusion protein
MQRKWPILAVAVLVIGGLAAWITMSKGSGKKGKQSFRPVKAALGTIEDAVESTGVVQPLNRVEIKPPISGRIEKILVDEGTRVRAGKVLAWMSSSDRAAILDAARAKGTEEVKRWEDAYKATPVLAPLSGSIILRSVVVGQTVDMSTTLFAMSDKLIVLADVDEADIGRIREGMPAIVTLDSYPSDPIEGKVFQILHEGKNTQNVITYGVKIEPKTVPAFFRSQMTANIRLIASRRENVVTLPVTAVTTTSSGERQVLVPGPEGKPIVRAVETGQETGDLVEIKSGLQDGETVLVTNRRYTAQRSASSPLVMGGRQGGGSGGNRGGDGGGRRP